VFVCIQNVYLQLTLVFEHFEVVFAPFLVAELVALVVVPGQVGNVLVEPVLQLVIVAAELALLVVSQAVLAYFLIIEKPFVTKFAFRVGYYGVFY